MGSGGFLRKWRCGCRRSSVAPPQAGSPSRPITTSLTFTPTTSSSSDWNSPGAPHKPVLLVWVFCCFLTSVVAVGKLCQSCYPWLRIESSEDCHADSKCEFDG